MAHSSGLLLVVAVLFHSVFAKSGGHPSAGPAVHVDAHGAITKHSSGGAEEFGDFVHMLRKAKANMANTINTAKMMRAEVRKHIPLVMEKASGTPAAEMSSDQLMHAFALLQSGEVNCSATGTNSEPVTAQLCKILVGNNTQVAGKLERAVKGLSLRPKTPNATEMVVADKVEDTLLTHLRAALWDMWFCAKRADPPCDPMTSQDGRVKGAREQAFDALHAIHTHADGPGGSTHSTLQTAAAPESVPSAGSNAKAPPAQMMQMNGHEMDALAAAQEGALLQTAEKTRRQTPVQPASEWASNVINNMLTPPDVTGKLYEAINNLDVDSQLETDIVRIENDEDGSMKKLKADLLLLHECASMPQCPLTGCCEPKNPTQAVYIQARNDAYVAYHNMEHDNTMAKVTYVDLLKNIAGPTTLVSSGGTTVVASGASSGSSSSGSGSSSETIEEPEPTNNTNSSNDTATPAVVDNGDSTMLLIALSVIGAIVLLAICYVAVKLKEDDKPKEAEGAGESWGEGEGEWGGQGY